MKQKPLDERLEEIEQQTREKPYQVNFTMPVRDREKATIEQAIRFKENESKMEQVSNTAELLEALKEGIGHIVVNPNTYVLKDNLYIPSKSTLDVRGGEFLFDQKSGLQVYGALIDRTEETTFDGLKKSWEGIEITGGKLNLSNAVIQNGQGNLRIECEGEATLGKNTIIQQGTSPETSDHKGGGGIYLEDGTLISQATIRLNQADDGGGIYIKKGNAKIDGLIAENTSGRGGGIYIYGGTVDLKGTIRNNTSHWGGGINIHRGHVGIKSIIEGNHAKNMGGGMFIDGGGKKNTEIIVQGIVQNNSAEDIIYCGSKEDNDERISSGGIYVSSEKLVKKGQISLSGCTQRGNTPENEYD